MSFEFELAFILCVYLFTYPDIFLHIEDVKFWCYYKTVCLFVWFFYVFKWFLNIPALKTAVLMVLMSPPRCPLVKSRKVRPEKTGKYQAP